MHCMFFQPHQPLQNFLSFPHILRCSGTTPSCALAGDSWGYKSVGYRAMLGCDPVHPRMQGAYRASGWHLCSQARLDFGVAWWNVCPGLPVLARKTRCAGHLVLMAISGLISLLVKTMAMSRFDVSL